MIAKFVPGFSTAAPPIAGALRVRLSGFLLAAGLGALLWAGVAGGAGWLLRAAVPDAIALHDRNTGIALLVVVVPAAVWLAWKVWQKVRFQRPAAYPHIMPAELFAALQSEELPLLLDLRGASMIA